MPALTSTTPGPKWISPKDAVALIEAHTKSNPTVDLPRMMRGYRYIRKGFVFNIFQRKRQGNIAINLEPIPCRIETALDAESMKIALKESFQKAAGHEFDDEPVRMMESIAEPSKTVSTSNAGKARRRAKKGNTAKGEVMVSGDITTGTGVRSDSTVFTDGMEG